MRKLVIEPDGWKCSLLECPPGFYVYQDQLCFKTEYKTKGQMEVYCSTGETFCVGDECIVQPVLYGWEEV